MIKIPLQCEYLPKNFYCLTDCTKKQAISWINKNYDNDIRYNGESCGCPVTFRSFNGYDNIFIWLNNKEKISTQLYTIFHEVGHAIFHMFGNCGVNPSDSSGEHFVYLQEYLVEQILAKNNKKLIIKK